LAPLLLSLLVLLTLWAGRAFADDEKVWAALQQGGKVIDMLHVPYRGVAPAMTDLLGGQVDVLFDPVPSSIGYVRSGQLRALAVTTTQRSQSLPDTPPLAETVPGYEASTWFGACAPQATPPEVIANPNSAFNSVLADPTMKATRTDQYPQRHIRGRSFSKSGYCESRFSGGEKTRAYEDIRARATRTRPCCRVCPRSLLPKALSLPRRGHKD
jgi:hypothetical protein